MANNTYKKLFLRTLIAALTISALIGIFIFLVGDFGETEIRLLLTTLTIGAYSLTGLCSSTIHNRKKLKAFSIIGMLISFFGFFATTSTIWELIELKEIWRLMIIFIILSVAIAHISLLLLIQPKKSSVRFSLLSTIVFISLVALMLINSTLTDFEQDEFYFRLLGVFSILDVLGTITTPILNNISEKKA